MENRVFNEIRFFASCLAWGVFLACAIKGVCDGKFVEYVWAAALIASIFILQVYLFILLLKCTGRLMF